ncbi:MAG: hypothetical protein ACI379_02325 [Nocardioides sp.]|uniref:hypothetical protein n=1 Tax=Nocardioides sp. TaxID=35761 RepID=UPI003F116971
MRTVPQELVALAAACDDGAVALEDAQIRAEESLALRGTPAGNSPGATSYATLQQRALESAEGVLDRFASVLTTDMDDLHETAFDFSTTDEVAAAGFAATTGAL